MKTVQRNQIADYLNVSKTGEATYKLMGVGFTSLDESPGAQTETKVYISDSSASTVIKSYETQFPFEADFVSDEEALMALYQVGRNHLTGIDAEFDYVRVDLYDTATSGSYPARKFRVACEISDCSGEGGETMVVSGNLNAVGDPVEGTFNVSTKTFTPAGA
ncbi:MAG: hypothetical protein ACRCX8_05935 [Sarcina sp.]